MKNGIIGSIFDNTMSGLEKSMDLWWKRNEAITSNVANAETPGYKAVDLNFSNELERAFKGGGVKSSSVMQTDPRHMDLSGQNGSHLVPDNSGQTRGDGNNVDIDIQMGRLAYNAGKYSMATNLVRKKLGFLKMAIRESGR